MIRPSIPPTRLAVATLAPLALLSLARPAAAFTPAEGKAPMTVALVRSDAPGCGRAATSASGGSECPEWLAMTGVIGPGTPSLFAAALARLGGRDVPVLVDSPGGSVEAAEAIGRVVRARRMTVAVAGTALDDCAPADRSCAALRRSGERRGFVAGGVAACASACVLILAAGAERSVGENSFVGVHQIVVRQTLTRVINTFRIMRRMVNGHPVEVSRTLVATRPVSSQLVTKAASDTMYSAVDRYLLGLGIAESIMPLMRATPPSGIHWMTRPELAATRIATDTSDARTLVDRFARPAKGASATPPRPPAMAVATTRLGTAAPVAGIVSWSVGRPEGARGPEAAPVLAAAVDVPGRPLRGTLALRRDEAPGGPGGFVAMVDLGDPAAVEPGRTWTVGAPSLCRLSECLPYFTAAAESDDGRGRRAFRVPAGWTNGFLSHLAAASAMLVPLLADDGTKGWASLALTDGTRTTVQDWEHLCCGLATSTDSVSGESRATLVPASPAPGSASAASSPEDGTVTWHLDAGATPGFASTLVGDVDVPHFNGTIALTLAPPASTSAALTVVLRAVPADGRQASVAAGPLGFRDGRGGEDHALAATVVRGGGVSTLTIPAAERRAVAEGFKDRPWFAVPLRTEGRSPVVLLLNLNGNGRRAVEAWLADEPPEATDAPPPPTPVHPGS